MDFSSLSPVAMIVLLIGAATPILLAAIGELVVEKSGVLNLGVEGMMIIGAVSGFIVAVNTDSPMLGLVGAAVGGAVVSMVFAFLTQYLLSNQVATGLALTLFGLGLAALMGSSYNGIRPPRMPRLDVEGLTDLPVVGRLFFSHDPVIYGSLVLVFAVWFFLNRTRSGLVLRACGENHEAAHSLGYNVQLIRFGAIMFGGACAGLGGRTVPGTDVFAGPVPGVCPEVTGRSFPARGENTKVLVAIPAANPKTKITAPTNNGIERRSRRSSVRREDLRRIFLFSFLCDGKAIAPVLLRPEPSASVAESVFPEPRGGMCSTGAKEGAGRITAGATGTGLPSASGKASSMAASTPS